MKQFITALSFSLKEQTTNKFAFGLLAIFVPIWYWMLGAITPHDAVSFKFQPTGGFIQADGHNLVLITAGLNVLSMILGFMFFHSAYRSLSFDQRLTRAGLSRLGFMSAKTITLITTTGLVSLYTWLVLIVFWHFPQNNFEVWLAFWLVSLIYASLGLLFGMFVRNELVGFFVVIMVSMMDVMLQNPIGNPAANKDFLKELPSYGAMQLGTAGGFTHMFAASQVAVSLLWAACFLLAGLCAFYLRTRRKTSVIQE
jgi:ABC-2 type transport system permease protein